MRRVNPLLALPAAMPFYAPRSASLPRPQSVVVFFFFLETKKKVKVHKDVKGWCEKTAEWKRNPASIGHRQEEPTDEGHANLQPTQNRPGHPVDAAVAANVADDRARECPGASPELYYHPYPSLSAR